MAEKRVTVPTPDGGTASGVEVFVTESTERWSDFTLEDGTSLRMKIVLTSAVRVDGKFDVEGNPLYMGKGQPVTVTTHVPENLKQTRQ